MSNHVLRHSEDLGYNKKRPNFILRRCMALGAVALTLLGAGSVAKSVANEVIPSETVACAEGAIENTPIDGAREAKRILNEAGHEVEGTAPELGQVALGNHTKNTVGKGDLVELCVDKNGNITKAIINSK